MERKEGVYTLGSVVLELPGGISLRGYAMTDGTFQFVIKGQIQTFQTLIDVEKAFTDS